jgi:oligoribonuclease NrnB/cAMP/cGMP phosphodiesterase (DHH superfamily)
MPVPLELLRKVQVVYSHAHCPDGLASAMILKDAFRMLGTSPRIEFLAHGTPEHREAGLVGRALFCDIAPTGGVADMTTVGPHVVLDHHVGAKDIVLGFNGRANGDVGVFADEKLEPGVSGAVLAFREVWAPVHDETSKDQPVELAHSEYMQVMNFARDVGARDTWQTKDERFQRGQWISKMLMSHKASDWLDYHSPYLHEEEVSLMGRALFEAHEEAVRQAVDQCVAIELGQAWNVMDGADSRMQRDVTLFVFQEQASGFRLTSDVAESLRSLFTADERFKGVVAGFSYVVDKPGGAPRLLYSLRGLNGFDVAAFAKTQGGGGHTAAAGFSIPLEKLKAVGLTPYEYVRDAIGVFLQ